MIRLVFSILLFIILAVFVALNAQNTTTVDLFGARLEAVSVAAVATIAMAVGVVYSFVLYLFNYLARLRTERLKNQKIKNKRQAEELKDKEKELQSAADEPGPQASPPAPGGGKRTFPFKRRARNDVPEEPSSGT